MMGLTFFSQPMMAQADSLLQDTTAQTEATVEELIGDEDMAALEQMTESAGFHQQLKSKFIEGSAGFMSLVALALVLGLAFCIERIIYLTLSEINAKKLLADIEKKVEARREAEAARGIWARDVEFEIPEELVVALGKSYTLNFFLN